MGQIELSKKKNNENVIARSANGSTLEVVKEGEKRELSPEKKAEIPEQIKKAEQKYQDKVALIEKKYQESVGRKSRSGMSEAQTIIDEKIRKIGLQRAQEDLDSRIKYLNSLK